MGTLGKVSDFLQNSIKKHNGYPWQNMWFFYKIWYKKKKLWVPYATYVIFYKIQSKSLMGTLGKVYDFSTKFNKTPNGVPVAKYVIFQKIDKKPCGYPRQHMWFSTKSNKNP